MFQGVLIGCDLAVWLGAVKLSYIKGICGADFYLCQPGKSVVCSSGVLCEIDRSV